MKFNIKYLPIDIILVVSLAAFYTILPANTYGDMIYTIIAGSIIVLYFAYRKGKNNEKDNNN